MQAILQSTGTLDAELQTATAALASLNAEVQSLRAEVAVLREVKRGLSGMLGDHLAHVNEQLVLAAIRAETDAEVAANKVRDLTMSGQHDALTGTPGRALMVDRIDTAIAVARRRASNLAVLFLDLDGFKSINDHSGHAAGDEILQLVAYRLRATVRDVDTVSRHGGDEFVVLLAEVSKASDAAVITVKLLRALAAPCQIGDSRVTLSASIGIAMYPEDGDTAVALIGRADEAMYSSKRGGPGRFAFYDDRDASDGPVAPPPAAWTRHGATNDTPDPSHERFVSYLRDANERLVIAAMTSHEIEARVDATHRRQITFLATVAHELRNPLTPILQAADLIHLPHANDPRLARLAGVIKRQVAHMARLIDDLVDGSRISTGKFRLDRRDVRLMDVLDTAIEAIRPSLDDRAQHFTLHAGPGSIGIHADPVRITQVFSNLLDNASKYTPRQGAIVLSVESVDDGVRVTLSDNGIGIERESLPKIFDLFVQEEHAQGVHSGGLGIGLSVVRELVEAHGGTVTGASAGRDLGSTFVVTLPEAQR